MRPFSIVLALSGAIVASSIGCSVARKDTLSPDVCHAEPPALAAAGSTERARAAAASVTHVVLGRVRWTGTVMEEESGKRRERSYAIVDILGFFKGDAWSIDPHMRRAFPLLSDGSTPSALACRTGQELFFFVRLPGAEAGAKPWPGGAPDPVMRAFGENSVELALVLPESERARVLAALTAGP